MFFSFIVALVFASAGVSVLAQSSCTRTHTVALGEICDGISAATNTSTYQLAVLNPSINAGCTNLVPGQVLCLGSPGHDCCTTYVVEPNDDCYKVADAHHIDLHMIYQNNPQLDAKCDNMYIGEVLCVAPTELAPPLPSNVPLPATSIPSTAQPALPTDTDLPWCD